MKIAIIIIAIVLSLFIGLQSLTIGGLSSIADSLQPGDSKIVDMQSASAFGMVASLFMFFGGALIYTRWWVSFPLFVLSGLFAAIGSTLGFGDLGVWLWVAVLLAVMSAATGPRKWGIFGDLKTPSVSGTK